MLRWADFNRVSCFSLLGCVLVVVIVRLPLPLPSTVTVRVISDTSGGKSHIYIYIHIHAPSWRQSDLPSLPLCAPRHSRRQGVEGRRRQGHRSCRGGNAEALQETPPDSGRLRFDEIHQPCSCQALARLLPGSCHALAMLLQCSCHAFAHLVPEVRWMSRCSKRVQSHDLSICYTTYYTILYSTLLCSALLYFTLLYSTMLCYNILFYTILYHTIPYHTILYYYHQSAHKPSSRGTVQVVCWKSLDTVCIYIYIYIYT